MRAPPTALWIFCRDSAHKMLEWEPVKQRELSLKPEERGKESDENDRSCLDGLDIKSED